MIAPYRAQVVLLRMLVPPALEVNTVDQFQGQDKEAVVYSAVRSDDKIDDVGADDNKGILEDHRRVTVAITRAKHKLVIVGNPR